MPFGRKSPLEALALPGVILAYKYSQFRQRRREAASRRVTERELAALHHKIDKLLNKLEESEPDPPTSEEDECVVCANARATMQTSPCGHRVVCRRCFVKTIQSAVAQRLLPLRCVICRSRVNRLTSDSGTLRLQESASNYSMGTKSWASVGVPPGGIHASASSYSMGDAHTYLPREQNPRFRRYSPDKTVAQSVSFYSMSSGNSGNSGNSNSLSSHSRALSSTSSGLSSPVSSCLSVPVNMSTQTVGQLKGPMTSSSSSTNISPISPSTLSPCGSSHSNGSLSPCDPSHSQPHHAGCPSGCSGAVPRKPLHALPKSPSSEMSLSSSSQDSGYPAAYSPSFPTSHYGERRSFKGRYVNGLQNRLPPIKECRSPCKVPHPSPVHNPRFRYASYTKPATACKETSPEPKKHPMNIQLSLASNAAPSSDKHSQMATVGSAKVCPKPENPKQAYCLPKDKKTSANAKAAKNTNFSSERGKAQTSLCERCNKNKGAATSDNSAKAKTICERCLKSGNNNSNANAKSSSRSKSKNRLHTCSPCHNFPTFLNKEKADNKKNECAERKKKEEKARLKAEKEAKKEEKRLAKEEERLAKMLAKEEKKKSKQEAKESLLNDCDYD